MCDDENVEPIEESDIFRYFGDYPSGAGYVLFYQAADLNLAELGLKVPEPVQPPSPIAEVNPQVPQVQPPAQGQNQSANLIDLDEPAASTANGVHPSIAESPFEDPPEVASTVPPAPSSPRQALKVAIPSYGSAPGQQPSAVPTLAPPVTSPPAQSAAVPIENVRKHSIDRQIGFTPSPATVVPPASKEKKDSSKWYNRMSKDGKASDPPSRTSGAPTPVRQDSINSSATSTGQAGRITPARQSTYNSTTSTTNGTPDASYSQSVPSVVVPSDQSSGANGMMSSSMMSTVSGTSASTQTTSTSAGAAGAFPPSSYQAPATLGRQTSVRDRTVSTSSATSNASAGSPNNGASYSGGSSLGRKLSGMSGKGLLGRSSSLMKMGLGKNKKEEKEAKEAKRISSMGYAGIEESRNER